MNAIFRTDISAQVPPENLEIAPENPRSDETINAIAIDQLADNIAVIGVLTPLIAYQIEDTFFVTAGGRRVRAIHKLEAEDRWPAEALVPVTVMDYEAAIDAGHAEQLTHQIMSDLDTIKVFAHEAYSGFTDKELAALTGRTERYVQQRRAILDLPELARQALFEGTINVNQAAGLTYWIEDDEGFTEKLAACIQNPRIDGDDLRSDFDRKCRAWSKSALRHLVDQETYLAAGGRLQGDLFAEEQFILSPAVLERLAREAAQIAVEEAYPNAAAVICLDGVDEYRTHPGVPQFSADEEAEWDEIAYDFYSWQSPEDVIEQIETEIEDAEEQATQKAAYARWQVLKAKSENVYPDDLDRLLFVGWSLQSWGDTGYSVRAHIIPTTTLEHRALVASGYLEAPKEVVETPEGETPEPEYEIAASHVDRIKRIKAHCARMDLIKRPNDVLALYLANISVASNRPATFANYKEPAAHLNEGDPAPRFSPAWEKADATPMTAGDIVAMKPAEQRTQLAHRLLQNLSTVSCPVEVDCKMLRDYIDLDARFFKAYKKPGMIAMIEQLTDGTNFQDLANLKAGAMADWLAKQFVDRPDWLPAGF